MERFSRVCRSACLLLRRGRSCAFADPALTALQAHHVWLPEAGASVLRAVASPLDSFIRDTGLLLPGLPSLEHILIDGDGRQHVVLRANGISLQLLISGTDVSALPTTLTF